MKTFLIVTNESIGKQHGRDVDGYITVKSMPTQDEMPAIANEIRNKIREIAIAGQKVGEEVTEVSIECDATPPYRVILVGLAEAMRNEEKIELIVQPDPNEKPREQRE